MELESWVKNWRVIWFRKEEVWYGWKDLGELLYNKVVDVSFRGMECVGVRLILSFGVELVINNKCGLRFFEVIFSFKA